jgi:methylated-DNA-protein-cysteine methyltransferase related protein
MGLNLSISEALPAPHRSRRAVLFSTMKKTVIEHPAMIKKAVSDGVAGRRGRSYITIWRAVKRIPRGRVSTYGVIARLAGLPKQARLVGYALHALPEGADVPWQRVVNAKGAISLPPVAARRQKALLTAEGIRFSSERIPLGTYGWPEGAFD